MAERRPSQLPFESSEPGERALWDALAQWPEAEPGPGLRRNFYHRLEKESRPNLVKRIGDWLGLGRQGWVTAAACLLLGFGVAYTQQRPGLPTDRLTVLEENVTRLQRQLVIDRLEDASAATRLRGVVEAGALADRDPMLVQALLTRAANDRSPSVRSAAIGILGPMLAEPGLGASLMGLLSDAESPLVQLELVDQVLRHGSPAQIRELRTLASEGRLHPDLIRHVDKALGGQSA